MNRDGSQVTNDNSELYTPFTREKVRGMLVSTATSVLANGINVFFQSVLGFNPLISSALVLQVGAGLVVYVLDILVAKENFNGRHVAYTEVRKRLKWLIRSFLQPVFFKYIITVIIDTLTFIEILRAVLQVLDENNIRFRFRNEICAALLSAGSFILYVNATRFNWAYNDGGENSIMNIIMLLWVTLTIFIFCVSHNARRYKSTGVQAGSPFPPPSSSSIQLESPKFDSPLPMDGSGQPPPYYAF